MSVVKEKLKAFLTGLDANDHERIEEIGLAAFDQYVTEVPGPNKFIKAQVRPMVQTAIKNAIADLLG